MKRSITRQLGALVIIFILVSLVITFIANYFLTYKQMYESAGIEAVGCANITTGLVDPNDLTAFMEGDTNKRDTLEKAVNWTVDHKPIFDSHYIITLDGILLVVDQQLQNEGFQHGDEFYIDEEVIEHIKETKSPTSAQHVYGSTAKQLKSMKEITDSVQKLDQMVEDSKELIRKFQINE